MIPKIFSASFKLTTPLRLTQAAVATLTAATISRVTPSAHLESLQLSLGKVEHPRNSVAQRKGGPTELGENGVAFPIQIAENVIDLVVGAADESVGGDGGGQSHGTTGEDRKDSGETHSERVIEGWGGFKKEWWGC